MISGSSRCAWTRLGTRAGVWGEAVPVADHLVPRRAGMLDCLTNEHNAFAIRLLQHAQFHVVSHRPTMSAVPALAVMLDAPRGTGNCT